MLTPSEITPKVSRCVVAFVRFSAELTPGKNLRAPKPRNTAPTATPQHGDAMGDELVMDDVLDMQQAAVQKSHTGSCAVATTQISPDASTPAFVACGLR